MASTKVVVGCLICGGRSRANDDKLESRRFANLCQILKVTMDSSQVWDFDKEKLALCQPCVEITDQLTSLLHQIEVLTFGLKQRLGAAEGMSGDKRIDHFRKLALSKDCKSKRKRTNPNRITNFLSESDNADSDSTPEIKKEAEVYTLVDTCPQLISEDVTKTKRSRKLKDFKENENSEGYISIDERRQKYNRKWKTDKKTDKLFYSGIEVVRMDSETLRCSVCQKMFKIQGDEKKAKQRIGWHIIAHHISTAFCPICDKRFPREKLRDEHIKRTHEKAIIIPCNICDKPFSTKTAMMRHRFSHMNEEEKESYFASGGRVYQFKEIPSEKYQCGTCGKMFCKNFALKKHEQIHESTRKKIVCQLCGVQLYSEDYLKQHMRRLHDPDKRDWLPCSHPNCPKKFISNSELSSHLIVHSGAKPVICEVCGGGYRDKKALRLHMLRHQGLRPHKCGYCEMAFFSKSHMLRHVKSYHETANPTKRKLPYRNIEKNKGKVKPFKCRLCPDEKAYYMKSHLKLHAEKVHRVAVEEALDLAQVPEKLLQNKKRKKSLEICEGEVEVEIVQNFQEFLVGTNNNYELSTFNFSN